MSCVGVFSIFWGQLIEPSLARVQPSLGTLKHGPYGSSASQLVVDVSGEHVDDDVSDTE